MPRELDGKVALITGSASGIGRAVAQRFLDEGARVVGLDRGETVLSVGNAGSTFLSMVGDVREPQANQRAVDLAVSRFGRLDVFVGNAGIYDNRRAFRTFTPPELDAAFDELFGIDVKGYLLGASCAAGALAASRGCIIFTSSVSGTHPGFGGALYVAAKHAINGLTKQLALELAPEIRVNAVAPGYVPTDLRGIDSISQQRYDARPAAADLLLQTIAAPDDYAAAYVFLASDASARIATGSVLSLDGGASLKGRR